MLSLFSRNHFIRSFLLLFLVILLKIPYFFYPDQPIEPVGGITALLSGLAIGKTFKFIASIILIYVEAVFINNIVIRNRLTRELTLWPGMFFIILISLIPELGYLSGALMGLLFFIATLNELMKIYKLSQHEGTMFNLGLWISIASLFYFPFIYFMVLILVGISILKYLKPLDILRLLIGIAVPYVLLFYYLFWLGLHGNFMSHTIADYTGFLAWNWEYDVDLLIKASLYVLLIIISIFNYNKFVKKKNVQAINKIDVLYWGLLFSGLVTLFIKPASWQYLIVALPFLCIFVTMSFISLRNSIIAEFLNLLILLFGFYIHYISFT